MGFSWCRQHCFVWVNQSDGPVPKVVKDYLSEKGKDNKRNCITWLTWLQI